MASSRDLNPRDAYLRKMMRRRSIVITLAQLGVEKAYEMYPDDKGFIDKIKDQNLSPDDVLDAEKIDSILRSF